MKANCYKCKFRGNIPGDAHSCCNHSSLPNSANMFDGLVNILSGKAEGAAKKLNIKGNLHGIRSGWFMWPANFDPIWLENCDGFEKKEEN